MQTFLFILCGLLIWLIVLSKKRMQEFLLSAGTSAIREGSAGHYAAPEMAYIRLTMRLSGRIGGWFWVELLAVVCLFVLFGCFASLASAGSPSYPGP